MYKRESRLGPRLHTRYIGWKAVEGRLLPVSCDMDVAPKALLEGWDVTMCAVPVAKWGWIVPLAVGSVDAFVL